MDRVHANLIGMNLDTFLRIITIVVNLLATSYICQSLKQAVLHCWRNPLKNRSRSVVICATKWFDRGMVKGKHSCETGLVQV